MFNILFDLLQLARKWIRIDTQVLSHMFPNWFVCHDFR